MNKLIQNRIARLCLFGSLALSLTGCAGNVKVIDHYDVPTDQLRRSVDIYEIRGSDADDQNYKSLGDIRGMSCVTNNRARNSDRRAAVEQLRLKVAELGADAYTTPVCETSGGIDWANNCWDATICYSTAVAEPE